MITLSNNKKQGYLGTRGIPQPETIGDDNMTIAEAIEELNMALTTYAGIEINPEALQLAIEALQQLNSQE